MYTTEHKDDTTTMHSLAVIHSLYDKGAKLTWCEKTPTAYWTFEGDKHSIVLGEPSFELAKEGHEGQFLKNLYRHERGHALYTNRDLKRTAKMCKDKNIPFSLLNLFEDIRIESACAKGGGLFRWMECMQVNDPKHGDALSWLYYIKCVETTYLSHPDKYNRWETSKGNTRMGDQVAEYYRRACKAKTTNNLFVIIADFLAFFDIQPGAEPESGKGGDSGEESEESESGEGSSESASPEASSDKPSETKSLAELLADNEMTGEGDMEKALAESEPPKRGQTGSKCTMPNSYNRLQADQITNEWVADQKCGAATRMAPDVASANRISSSLNGLVAKGRSTKLARRGRRPVARSVARTDWDRLFIGKAEGSKARPKLLILTDMSGSMDGIPARHAATINLGLAKCRAVDTTHVFTSRAVARRVDQSVITPKFFEGGMAGSGSEGIASYVERYAGHGLAKEFDYVLCITDGHLTDGVPDWKLLAAKGLDRIAAIYVGDADESVQLKKHFKRHLSVTDVKDVAARLKALLRK